MFVLDALLIFFVGMGVQKTFELNKENHYKHVLEQRAYETRVQNANNP